MPQASMVLDRLLQEDESSPKAAFDSNHFHGAYTRRLSKIVLTVHKVVDVKAMESHPRSKMWFTLNASSPANITSEPMGKIQSSKVLCSGATFKTSHELLVDTDMVPKLIFKLKYASTFLSRKVTVGSHRFDIASGEHFNGSAQLEDTNGTVVGRVVLSLQIMPTIFPAMHFAPQPFWKIGSKDMTRQYCTLSCEGQKTSLEGAHAVDYIPGMSNLLRIQSPSHRVTAKQDGDMWRISEQMPLFSLSAADTLSPARKYTLRSSSHEPVSPLMHFSLQQTAGLDARGPITLVPGNVLDPSSGQEWGVWSLVHATQAGNRAANVTEDNFVALIHLVGASVECSSPEEVGLALAVANAMLWASVQHAASYRRLHSLIASTANRPMTTITPLGSAHSGRGFFSLSHSAATASDLDQAAQLEADGPGHYASKWGETRLQLASRGRGRGMMEEELSVLAILRGQPAVRQQKPLMAGPGAVQAGTAGPSW